MNQWCESGVFLLASQAVDKCQSQEGAESGLADIERFQETANEKQLTELRNIHNQYEMVLSEDIKVTQRDLLHHQGGISRYKPFRKSSSYDITGRRVHLDVCRIDGERLLRSIG